MKNNTYYGDLKRIFHLCDPIKSSSDISKLISVISDALGTMAMVNYPYPTNFVAPLPAWPVKESCAEAMHCDP
jgi:lysosomal Pro-X carboxypeptidase